MSVLMLIARVKRRFTTNPYLHAGGAVRSGDVAVAQPEGFATRLLGIAILVIVPLVFTVASLHAVVGHGFAFDFHNQYWPAGRRVLGGLSPYDLGWQDINNHIAFPYGAVPALLFVPFALLPHGVADAVYVGLCFAAVPLTLRLLGVRDWRVYGIVFLWVPVIAGWVYANVPLVLCPGLALMWRYRDRAFVVGLLAALVVSIKLFVWPLAIWLLGTRRYAALGYAALCGAVLNLAAWLVIGFDQIGPYVKILHLVSDFAQPSAFNLQRLIVEIGASQSVAYALMSMSAMAVGVACFVLARRGLDESALMLCIAMGFLATPVTWPHYWALLIVPLAVLRPRFSLVWALPVAMLPLAAVLATWGSGAVAAGENLLVVALVIVALRPQALAVPAVARLRTA